MGKREASSVFVLKCQADPAPLTCPSLHAALRLPRTGAAARADDARGESSASAIHSMLSTCEAARMPAAASSGITPVAAAAPAGLRHRRDHLFAVEALRIERRQQVHAHGEHASPGRGAAMATDAEPANARDAMQRPVTAAIRC